MDVFIYALSDPRTNEIRYVGKAKNATRRFSQHISNSETGKKAAWIRGLISLSLRPCLDVLQVVSENEWEESEQWWISYLRSIGCPLLNIDKGGNGAHKVSEEMREKCRLIHLGKKRSNEARQKMRAAQLGKKQSKETIKKRADAIRGKRLGKPMHPNALTALVKYHKGRKHTQDEIKKRVAGNIGQKRGEETKAKMRAAWQIRKQNKNNNEAVLSTN